MRKEHPLQYFLVTTLAVGILYAGFQLFYIKRAEVVPLLVAELFT
jgi:hypothetical protein